jgi:hypothetical protein
LTEEGAAELSGRGLAWDVLESSGLTLPCDHSEISSEGWLLLRSVRWIEFTREHEARPKIIDKLTFPPNAWTKVEVRQVDPAV